jgi:hypothetical protein
MAEGEREKMNGFDPGKPVDQVKCYCEKGKIGWWVQLQEA